jgi:hypothetical protein
VIKKRKRVHGGGECVEPVWQHQRLDGPFAGLMEKIMSKSNDSSFTVDLGGDATSTVRELRDDELENVSGGSSEEPVESMSFNFLLAQPKPNFVEGWPTK